MGTDYYPRVVSIEKFTAVNQLLSGRAKSGGRDFRRFNNLLSGLPRCAKCDGTAAYENKGDNSFTTHVTKSGEVKKYPRKLYERLRCDNNRRRKGCDNNELFDYRVVENAVLDQLLGLTAEQDARSSLTQALDEQIASTVRDIEVAHKRLENIIDALADGGSKSLTKRVSDLESEIETLEARHKALVSEREAEASSRLLKKATAWR